MGSSESKPEAPPQITMDYKRKETDIQIKTQAQLPKLDLTSIDLPKAPVTKTRKQLLKDKEEERISKLVPFNLKKEFDLETYEGRFRHQVSRLNPLLFFHSDKQIKEAREKIFKYTQRQEAAENLGGGDVRMEPAEIEEIKKASRIVGGAVHPDTNEIIPFYMRLSGFVVFNAPIVCLVLFKRDQTPLFNAGMQWVNQTYNAGLNYGNRNASSDYTTSDLARGYSAAVVISMGVAMLTRKALASQISRLSGTRLIFANAGLNYIAAAGAGSANLIFMRWKEIKEGVDVQNDSGDKTYGKSVVAGKQAIAQTAFSRFVLPLPVLFFPAIANYGLVKARLWPHKVPAAGKLIELALCCMSLTVALPLSIAMFRQRSVLSVDNMEEEFKELKDEKTGEKITHFFFNKGS